MRLQRTPALACTALSLAALVVPAARADEDPPHGSPPVPSSTALLVHPILGLELGFSDSGRDVGLQVGIRVSPFLLWLSAQTTGLADTITAHPSGRHFDLVAAHAGYIFAASEHVAGFAGLGYGWLRYGYPMDSPFHRTAALLPVAGVILGHRREAGRLIFELTIVLPLTSNDLDPRGQIDPPRAMASLVFSL